MKNAFKIALLASAGICLTSVAIAADLPETAPVVAPAMASNGQFYAGFNVGYASGNADHQPANPPNAPFANGYDMGLSGFIVGGQVGAMFHLDNNMVLGVQGDVDWSNLAGGPLVTGQPAGNISQSINWIATLEARFGFDAGGFTPYLAAGIAAAQGTRSTTAGGGVSDTEIQPGLSVGAGVVFPVSDNVSLDLEARYQAFRATTYQTGGPHPPSVALSDTSIRAGLNFSF